MDGDVDITLIDSLLELTPEQRIRQNDLVLRAIEELRDALARAAHDSRDTGDARR
jgi:hypothetical protein